MTLMAALKVGPVDACTLVEEIGGAKRALPTQSEILAWWIGRLKYYDAAVDGVIVRSSAEPGGVAVLQVRREWFGPRYREYVIRPPVVMCGGNQITYRKGRVLRGLLFRARNSYWEDFEQFFYRTPSIYRIDDSLSSDIFENPAMLQAFKRRARVAKAVPEPDVDREFGNKPLF